MDVTQLQYNVIYIKFELQIVNKMQSCSLMHQIYMQENMTSCSVI